MFTNQHDLDGSLIGKGLLHLQAEAAGEFGRPEVVDLAWVYDDPETLFDVQYDNPSSGTTVQTAVGEECDWTVASPGGSTQTGLSNTYLTAIQATSGQFQITGFAYSIFDSITDAYVQVTVRINEHHYKAAVNSV